MLVGRGSSTQARRDEVLGTYLRVVNKDTHKERKLWLKVLNLWMSQAWGVVNL